MPKSKKQTSKLSDDYCLQPYMSKIDDRYRHFLWVENRLTEGKKNLKTFASGHEFFGLHKNNEGWVFTEWAPNATAIFLIGDFSNWEKDDEFLLNKIDDSGIWQIELSENILKHGDLYRLKMCWDGGEEDRIPAYARRVVQDEHTKIFTAQVWAPKHPYKWKFPKYKRPDEAPLIYEAHVGMAQEKHGVGTYLEFKNNVLPGIIDAGYNTLQLMAIMEHPYYGSFGYHVSNFFAASSRFGTPEEFKELIDAAHEAGLAVIMDLVHSHAVKNEIEGLSKFDGTYHQYFHEGARGSHDAWDSKCFDYGKPEVLHFLLSNCRFWLDEYKLDGFRFDGITSMMYHHHGLGSAFDSYEKYFDGSVDDDALAYLSLANKLIHSVRPGSITIAEDVSGMPGLAAPLKEHGCGFDYRLAMGVPDHWFDLMKNVPDDDWNMNTTWHELTNRRADEKVISYVECHDQAIVGGKTVIFQLIDADMYYSMRIDTESLKVDRGIALHKIIRLATLASAGHGYLNFIGNEFGHPEWVDFPREGNNWSHHYARRQWSLRDNEELKYHFLANFDREIISLIKNEKIIETRQPRLLRIDNNDKIICFERNNFIFIFNFHPTHSVVDYGVEVFPGNYSLVLNSDEKRFGGFERIKTNQIIQTVPVIERNTCRNFLRFYLPCRTAMVLKAIAL